MESIQKTRPEVMKSVKKQPVQVNIRLLNLASAVESNMVSLVIESALPKELEVSQVVEYKKGLEALSSEFKNQSVEYTKISEKLAETEKSNADRPSGAAPISFNLDKWKLPKEYQTEDYQKKLYDLGLFYMLTSLDMRKARKEIDEKDYPWVRSWLLLRQNNPAMTQYVYDELTAQKQTEILNVWNQRE